MHGTETERAGIIAKAFERGWTFATRAHGGKEFSGRRDNLVKSASALDTPEYKQEQYCWSVCGSIVSYCPECFAYLRVTHSSV
jgi:hypothetical protein